MAKAAALKTDAPHVPPPNSGAAPGHFAYAMLTDPGRVRHANQDACAAAPEHAAFVVCDGVGGAAGGEIASQLAAESFLTALRSSATQHVDEQSGAPSRLCLGGKENGPPARLHRAVVAANAAVFERGQRTRALRGMATTLVAALLEYPRVSQEEPFACPTLWLVHAGDSRVYRFRLGANGGPAELTQLTSDHSLVEEQIRAGLVSRLAALHSPVRNVITRAVGAAPTVEPDIASHATQPGDLYLLASDGLTRELDDAEIARILSSFVHSGPSSAPVSDSLQAAAHALGRSSQASQPALEDAAQALIDTANQHGGRDNITVLLLACH